MTTQAEITEALNPYGIEVSDAFVERFENDALVQALVTIVVGQQQAMKATVKEAFEAGVKQGFDAMEKHFDSLMEKPI